MTALTFRVVGNPAPQGSKKHVGNGVMVESSRAVTPWRQDVAAAATKAAEDAGWTPPRIVGVTVVFWFRRPKHHYRTGRNAHLLRDGAPMWHTTKPDNDKLQRSTFDALVTAGVIRDDSHIASVAASKRYATATYPTGALIIVQSLEPLATERANE
jgi:crossover junction endodeoxyribonuclease RusA